MLVNVYHNGQVYAYKYTCDKNLNSEIFRIIGEIVSFEQSNKTLFCTDFSLFCGAWNSESVFP